MSLKFKPEMFDNFYSTQKRREKAAEMAQELFDNWLAEQPVAYGDTNSGEGWAMFQIKNPGKGHTHKCRLVAIESIVCDHSFMIDKDNKVGVNDTKVCLNCLKKFKVSFQEIPE